jgi:hypothetical protein
VTSNHDSRRDTINGQSKETLSHRWPVVCTCAARDFNVHVTNAWIRYPNGIAWGKRREGEHRKYSGSLLETVLDVNVNGVIRFAIARARRVHLRFALVLLVAQERPLFGERH